MSNPFSLVLAPINLLLSAFLLACLLQIAVADLERRNISLPDVLRRAAGKILPVVGALILVFLGCMIGITLFIVPGIILALMWAVALPSTVAETSNPLRALGRSRALTKGNRWRIFGLALLAWLVFFALELVIVGAAGGMAALARGPSLGLGAIALISLISLIIYVVGAVGSAALYVQLRELKGAGGESVAQVFA
jgi:uncharacterized membrane protein